MVYKRSKYQERNGNFYGITNFMRGHCKLSGVKQQTIQSVISSEDYEMVGYAIDETTRLHRLTGNKNSILCACNFTERDAFNLCDKYGLLSPLYELGCIRDGCWFCPNCDKKTRKFLTETYPELVLKIYNFIEMCGYDTSCLCKFNNWLNEYYNNGGKEWHEKQKHNSI